MNIYALFFCNIDSLDIILHDYQTIYVLLKYILRFIYITIIIIFQISPSTDRNRYRTILYFKINVKMLKFD